MEVYEKINYLIEEKNLSKKIFIEKLLSLEPKLKATGEIPTAQTIYRYLNGQREIKIELVPYIAEVLNVDEQELFRFDIEYSTSYNTKYSNDVKEILNLIPYIPINIIQHTKEQFEKYKKLHDETIRKI